MNDEELIRQFAKHRDHNAFAQLVRRHFDWVYSTSLRLTRGDHAQADDVSQAVFILLARKAASLRRGTVLVNWLFAATQFCHREMVRRELRLRNRERQAAKMRSEILNHSEPAWDALATILDDLVGRLSKKDRRIILLRFYQGKTFAEIGSDLQLSEEAARKRVSRSLEELRQQFARRGATLGAIALGTVLAANVTRAAPAAARAATISLTVQNGSMPIADSIARFAAKMMARSAILHAGIPILAMLVIALCGFSVLFLKPTSATPPRLFIAQTASPTIAYTGRVLNQQGGSVANARVMLVGDNLQVQAHNFHIASETTTDSNGRFTLQRSGISNGILVKADGFALTGGRIVDADKGAVHDITLREQMTLRLHLINPDNQPAAHVRATVRELQDSRSRWDVPLPKEFEDSFAATSDEQGICDFSGLPRDAIIIPQIWDDRLRVDTPSDDGIQLTTGPDGTFDAGTLQLARGSMVSGHVFDAQTHLPVPGVRVFSSRWISVSTDEQGSYRLTQVIDPSWIKVDLPSSDPITRQYANAIPIKPLTGQVGKDISDADWQLTRGGILRVEVTVSGSPEPLRSIPLQVRGPRSFIMRSPENGSAEATVIPGEQEISILDGTLRQPAKAPPSQRVTIEEGKTTSIEFALSSAQLTPLPPPRWVAGNGSGSVRMKVIDENGLPLVHARIRTMGGLMVTGANGSCLIDELPAGSRQIFQVAVSEQYEIALPSMNIETGKTTDLTVIMKRAARPQFIPPVFLR